MKEKLQREGLYEDVLKISEKIVTLLEKYYTAKLFLENYEGIKVILKPPKPVEPYSPKPAVVLAISVASGLFLGIFLAFFVEWWEENKRKHGKEAF